ncbi:MAG: radical SAM protein [bacterium]|nr:radical SAM protein [bacterium]
MKPRIYSIFLPQQGCPNQCIYCNQVAVTGIKSSPSYNEIQDQIVSFLAGERTSIEPEIAFYGSNFTGLAWSTQQELLELVKRANRKTGKNATVRISTRPDYINEPLLARLKRYNVSTIELGIQSLSNEVLATSRRGYTAETALAACRNVISAGFQLGVHLMLGLPYDSEETALQSIDKILSVHPNFIRLHPTLVLRDTELAELYYTGKYQPLSLDQAIAWCKEIAIRCEQSAVPIVRFGLQPTPELGKPGTIIAGPFHPAFGELVKSAIAFDRMHQQLANLFGARQTSSTISFYVPANELSIYRGQHNQNITRLKQLWRIDNLMVKAMRDNHKGIESGEKISMLNYSSI